MQTKTYFADSVPAALDLARRELGAEALLVSSKPSPLAARSLGRLEVTFAFEAAGVSGAEVSVRLPLAHARGSETNVRNRRPASELDEIREQLAAIRAAVGQAACEIPAGHRHPVEPPSEENRLRAAGIEEEIAREIADRAARRPGDRQSALREELAGRMPRASWSEMKAGESRTVAFVGPAGRGKTTSLVKVAVRCGLALRIPVRIYGAGAHGVGGQEQIARYAAILGVPFQACESLESLSLALNGDGWKGLALIDTPGLSLADTNGIAEFAGFFSRRPEIEKHLVLRADARSADMLHVVSRFAGLGPSRLLFTGVEEALSVGAMVTTLVRSRIPAVFAGTGQEIPDDLEQVNILALARLVCGETRDAAPEQHMFGKQKSLAAVAA
jgi:flagellar biosynthesis protein FlhF